MTKKFSLIWKAAALLLLATMLLSACAPAPAPTAAPTEAATEAPKADDTYTFGMILVGPYNDHGYSQAHYEGGLYVEKNLPGSKMIYLEKVNSADRPNITAAQLASELVAQGAKMIIFNSDDFKDNAVEFAKANPEIAVIHASGDSVWKDGKSYQDIPNMANIMGRMEYGKMIGGCAAALTTKTGKIGYLGPLINDETRRLAASAYLGARYCWTEVLGKPAEELAFKVTWIGFWFNIPGVTSDPTQVANDFYNSDYDVVISGIDTTEALTEAQKANAAGKAVRAIPYDFKSACDPAPEVCLGVPYFNWGPEYLKAITTAKEGKFTSFSTWVGPDWKDINSETTSMVGFEKGKALEADASTKLDKFIADLAGGLNLWTGPINLQDGTAYLKEGEVATDQQIWYLPQLLEGMEGQSVSQ